MAKLGRQDIRALEAQIEDDPDDLAPYRVYSDWLQSRGDPRGELIAVQAELSRLRELERASAALMREHREHFLGPLAQWQWDAGSPITATWELGFIHRLSASLLVDSMSERALADLLGRVLDHGSARFIRGVHVFCSYPAQLAPVLAVLSRGKRSASLRALHLGETDLMLARKSELPAIGNVEPILAAYPRLREVVLNGRARLGRVRLPRANRLVLADCDEGAVTSLLAAEWSHLEVLELALARDDSGTGQLLGALGDVLTPARLPRLRTLHLCGFPPSFSGQVVASDLMEQLASLALTQGSADAQVAEQLYPRAVALGGLEELDLTDNHLGERDLRRLRELPLQLTAPEPSPLITCFAPVRAAHCSFCGKARDEVCRLIAGPRVSICGECVTLCQEILDEPGQ